MSWLLLIILPASCRSTIRNKIIPHAVSWFTAEAMEGQEFDIDDDEDDDDIEEDEDDDDEMEEDSKTKKKVWSAPSKSNTIANFRLRMVLRP